MNSAENCLQLFHIILLIAIPGAFGGFVSALFDENTALWTIIGRSLIGIAGAFGVILIGFGLGKISTTPDILNQLFLISFSLVGGTISFRILPKIGVKLEEQLQLRLEQTKREVADVVDKKSAETRDYSAAITSADAALAREKIPDMKLARDMLEGMRENFPINRTLHVRLGRLHRKLGDYDKAILVLRDFIEQLEKEHSTIGKHPHYIKDSADAYFNIACYQILTAEDLSKCQGSLAEIERHVSEGLENLKDSIGLLPSNREDANSDGDFDFVRGNSEFKKLVET